MDDTSKSVEVKDIKFENFFEVLKTIIYSTMGIIIFFIPITIDNQTMNILHHISYKLQSEYKSFLQVCTLTYIIIGTIRDRKSVV